MQTSRDSFGSSTSFTSFSADIMASASIEGQQLHRRSWKMLLACTHAAPQARSVPCHSIPASLHSLLLPPMQTLDSLSVADIYLG